MHRDESLADELSTEFVNGELMINLQLCVAVLQGTGIVQTDVRNFHCDFQEVAVSA